ncbi:hypothetical protein SAMN05192534_11925 [Alteribacillus persepolensis]|uniref:Uncharacterized protein n=1 Tax=Alteribacillus persepolensis TaxID=568899 RepID=A0A1G8HAV9_9BACI|nr:hypothetical protein [Alteribacillus persepolensis]SDI03772.1 hypothetical protein SAMN05192534_11925 [Alteribacillus persepolensis]
MTILVMFWAVALVSLIAALKWKKPLLLTVPFAAMGLYMFVEIIKVPMPFWETVQMIFDLR